MAYMGKYMKPSGRPPVRLGSLMMRIAAVLLCLVMVSIHLMSSMYAKYSTHADGSDDARVAKFDVKVIGSGDVTVDCMISNDGTYTFTVHNNSEVAVKYSVLLGYSEASYLTPTFNEDSVSITYPDTSHIKFSRDVWRLAPGATSDPHVLAFTVDWTKFTEDKKGYSASIDVAFTITVHVEQVD